jgi:hypothetical protein
MDAGCLNTAQLSGVASATTVSAAIASGICASASDMTTPGRLMHTICSDGTIR